MSAAAAMVRLALGGLFLWAAATKLPDMAAFAESVANYRLLPAALVPAAAAVVIGLEIAAGALLVSGRLARGAALVAAALLAVFTAALAQALLRGIDLRCGCFGGSESATWWTVLRDLAMLAGAGLVVARGEGYREAFPGRLAPRAEDAMGHGHGHRHGDGHGHGHGHGGGPGRDRHGNPEDFEAYLARLDDPERATWQKPDQVVAALGLRPGDVACDVGVGPGHFAIRMAKAVGPAGRVHAIDVDPRMIALVEERAREAGVRNVRPLLSPDGGALPPEPCDVVLVVNTFHHFADGPATLRSLAGRLRPGGRIVNVDFHQGELPMGPPPDHKVSREDFLAAADRAGLAVEREETFLPYQYLVVLRPR